MDLNAGLNEERVPLQRSQVRLLIMPKTTGPRVLLALTALNVAADLNGALATAVGADPLATSGFVSLAALKKCGDFSSIRENAGDLVDSVVGDFVGLRIVLVVF